jgi:hypothetical protein
MDLNKTTIENVIGRLRVFEERDKPPQITDATGRLMLCEEDWEARRKARGEQEGSGGSTGSSSRGKHCGRGRGRGGDGSSSRDGRDGQSTATGNAGGEGHHMAPAVIIVAKRATGPRTAVGRRRVRLMSRRPRRTSMC